MDREAWRAAVHGVAVRRGSVTEQHHTQGLQLPKVLPVRGRPPAA